MRGRPFPNARRQQAVSIDVASRVKELAAQSDCEPDAAFDAGLVKRILQCWIQRLKAESASDAWQRFERHFLESLDARTVAARLNCSNQVYVSTSRLRSRLRELCNQLMNEFAS